MACFDPELGREESLEARGERRTADQHQAAERRRLEPVAAEHLAAQPHGSREGGLEKLLKLAARHLQLESGAVSRCNPERFRLFFGELDPHPFGLDPQPGEGLRMVRVAPAERTEAAVVANPVRHAARQSAVEILAAEMVVAVMVEHLEAPAARAEQRDVEGPAAEIVDEPIAVPQFGRADARDRRGDRLLQQRRMDQARELRGAAGRLALGQLEHRRDGDHRGLDAIFGIRLSAGDERLQHFRRKLLGGHAAPVAEGDALGGAHQALEFGGDVGRIRFSARDGLVPDPHNAVRRQMDDGRDQDSGRAVDYLGADAHLPRDCGIGRAKVDPEIDAASHMTTFRLKRPI